MTIADDFNYLDLRCPKCHEQTGIDILAEEVWIRVCRDGTDPDQSENGGHTFTSKSQASCLCGHAGLLEEFEIPEQQEVQANY